MSSLKKGRNRPVIDGANPDRQNLTVSGRFPSTGYCQHTVNGSLFSQSALNRGFLPIQACYFGTCPPVAWEMQLWFRGRVRPQARACLPGLFLAKGRQEASDYCKVPNNTL